MRWNTCSILALATLTAGTTALSAQAQRPDSPGGRLSVTVAFGAGLNTQGADNHHILPPVIKVKAGGVVNFAVAGFHQIFVYSPGKGADDVVVPETGTFIDDLEGIFYKGLATSQPDPPDAFSHAQNRVESVAFPEAGTYLVICNVRTHFIDGMYAYVVVEE